MKHEFPVDGPTQLDVELRSGELTVRATTTDTVTVELTGSRAGSVVVEAHRDRVSVVEPRRVGFFDEPGDLGVLVTLPSGSRLTAKLGSAPVRAEGELGAVRVSTGSGDVTLDAVGGTAVVKSGAGDITVASLGAESQLKSGAGTIRVGHVGASTRLTTGAGSIEVGRADAPVVLKSGSGDLSVAATSHDTTLSAASGDLRVSRLSRGQVDLKNVSGDIRLGIPEGTPVWTDISTGTGRVLSTLTPTGAPAEGQDHVEVRARSVSGDVYLERLPSEPPTPATGRSLP